jgi:serine/threonine protein kinase
MVGSWSTAHPRRHGGDRRNSEERFSPPPGLPAGTVLVGAYQLTRLISGGSMGMVYEAVQLRLNRCGAVKIMMPELTDNLEALARFRREVKVTSSSLTPTSSSSSISAPPIRSSPI